MRSIVNADHPCSAARRQGVCRSMKTVTRLVLVVALLMPGCGSVEGGSSETGAQQMKRLPRDLSVEESRTRAYRDIWATSYNLSRGETAGPGITLIVDSVTIENTSNVTVEPVCWLWYGSQMRLLEAIETPVIPPGGEAPMEGTVYFPHRLDAWESEMLVCRDKRDDELAPEDE